MTTKKATNYFPHDSNARNDEKLLRLRMRHGAAGYGVYFMILERLREETNYMSAKDYNMIAFDLRVDAQLIKSVVEDFGLFAFTECGKCFYSESFLSRMEVKDDITRKRSEAGRRGNEKRWANTSLPDSHPIANQSQTDSKPIANQSQEKKRKENKENISSETITRAREDTTTGDEHTQYLQRFFRKDNQTHIEVLLMKLGLQPQELPRLKQLAHEVISEWKATDTTHTSYTDWSRHLIATMRIKYNATHNTGHTNAATKQPTEPADYTYQGGFGSQDI